jgi:hypothetical protein
MKIKTQTATQILDLMATQDTPTPIRSAIMLDEEFVEVNGEDYEGDSQKLNAIEDSFSGGVLAEAISLEIEHGTGVISIETPEAELSVTHVFFSSDIKPASPPKIPDVKTLSLSVEGMNIPEFFMLDQEGFAVALKLTGSYQLDLGLTHVCDQDPHEHAAFAHDLLGEADDILLLVLDHVTPAGDLLTSLISRSRAPEKCEAVFEFHGLQKRVPRSRLEAA